MMFSCGKYCTSQESGELKPLNVVERRRELSTDGNEYRHPEEIELKQVCLRTCLRRSWLMTTMTTKLILHNDGQTIAGANRRSLWAAQLDWSQRSDSTSSTSSNSSSSSSGPSILEVLDDVPVPAIAPSSGNNNNSSLQQRDVRNRRSQRRQQLVERPAGALNVSDPTTISGQSETTASVAMQQQQMAGRLSCSSYVMVESVSVQETYTATSAGPNNNSSSSSTTWPATGASLGSNEPQAGAATANEASDDVDDCSSLLLAASSLASKQTTRAANKTHLASAVIDRAVSAGQQAIGVASKTTTTTTTTTAISDYRIKTATKADAATGTAAAQATATTNTTRAHKHRGFAKARKKFRPSALWLPIVNLVRSRRSHNSESSSGTVAPIALAQQQQQANVCQHANDYFSCSTTSAAGECRSPAASFPLATRLSPHGLQLCSCQRPGQMVMISYVQEEARDYALSLKEALERLGVSVYLDLHEIRCGSDWQDSLNWGVLDCQVFVPLVTPNYGITRWTGRELKLADVASKLIIPVNFGQEWPPRALGIQFATKQYISWLAPDASNPRERPLMRQFKMVRNRRGQLRVPRWRAHCVENVARNIKQTIEQFASGELERTGASGATLAASYYWCSCQQQQLEQYLQYACSTCTRSNNYSQQQHSLADSGYETSPVLSASGACGPAIAYGQGVASANAIPDYGTLRCCANRKIRNVSQNSSSSSSVCGQQHLNCEPNYRWLAADAASGDQEGENIDDDGDDSENDSEEEEGKQEGAYEIVDRDEIVADTSGFVGPRRGGRVSLSAGSNEFEDGDRSEHQQKVLHPVELPKLLGGTNGSNSLSPSTTTLMAESCGCCEEEIGLCEASQVAKSANFAGDSWQHIECSPIVETSPATMANETPTPMPKSKNEAVITTTTTTTKKKRSLRSRAMKVLSKVRLAPPNCRRPTATTPTTKLVLY